MKAPILTALLRWRSNPQSDGLETILDIKRENVFLRHTLLLFGAGLVILSGHILLHPNRREIVYLSTPCGAPVYSDAPANVDQPSSVPQAEADGLAGLKALVRETVVTRLTQRSHRAKSPARPAPSTEHGVAVSTGTPAGNGISSPLETKISQSDLWSLLDQIRNDPTRDLIEKNVETNGVTVAFHEITADGKVHFDLTNGGNGTVYLPSVEGPGILRVFVERRVLDPGTTGQGVILLKQRGNRLDLTFKAANVAAYQFQIEVPK